MYNIEKQNSEAFMKSIKISLQMAQNVKEFVKIVQDYPYEIDLKSDKYVVDAKSILGIFSLDLSKPLVVEIHSDNCDDLVEALKKFAIDIRIDKLYTGDKIIRFFMKKADFLSVEKYYIKGIPPCRSKAICLLTN